MFLYWVKITSLIMNYSFMGCWVSCNGIFNINEEGYESVMGNNKSDNKKEKKRA